MTVLTWTKPENVFSNTNNVFYCLSQNKHISFFAALVTISYDDVFRLSSCTSPFATCFTEIPENTVLLMD